MNEAFPTTEFVDIPPEAWWSPSEFLDLDDVENVATFDLSGCSNPQPEGLPTQFPDYPTEGWWSPYLVDEQPFDEPSDGDCSSVRWVGNRAQAPSPRGDINYDYCRVRLG